MIGCLALAMLLATYGRGVLREHPFWISLLFYSLFILATITLGRAGCSGFAGDRLRVHDLLDSLGGERLRDAGKDGIRHNGQSLEPCYSSPIQGQYF